MERATDPAYLQYQYGTTERLHIRREAHQRYSERQDDFIEWVLDCLNPGVGDLVLDVGCGVGSYHAPLRKRGRDDNRAARTGRPPAWRETLTLN